MSMRALWFLLFVLAPLATLAGYGSTYGIGSAGGGVTVGNAVSGGTTSRLLFNDASGLVSTASPALGAGLALNPGPLTVSSCDPATTGDAYGCSVVDMAATAASGDKARVTRFNGTTVHSIDRDGNQVNAGTLTVNGGITGGGSTCAGYAGFGGDVCIGDTVQESVTVRFNASSISGKQAINLIHIGGGRAGVSLNYNGSTANSTISGTNNDLTLWGDADLDMIFQPGNSTSVTFEDFGEVRLHRNATGGVTGTDCDSDAEVGRLRRYSKDANNITLCWCQKRAGSYEWAAGPLGGDCT